LYKREVALRRRQNDGNKQVHVAYAEPLLAGFHDRQRHERANEPGTRNVSREQVDAVLTGGEAGAVDDAETSGLLVPRESAGRHNADLARTEPRQLRD
jgi:hypothetical protein